MRLLDFFAYYALLNARARNLNDDFATSSVSIMIGTILSGLGTLIIMLAAYALGGYVLINHEGMFLLSLGGLFIMGFAATGRTYVKRYTFITSDQFKPFILKKSAGVAIAVTLMLLSLALCMVTAIFLGVKS